MGEDVGFVVSPGGVGDQGHGHGTSDKPPALSKKTLAIWKKQLKNLKLKDAARKIEGIQFCAQDELFFREPEVLPLLLGFLSRPKFPEVVAETLTALNALLSPEPANVEPAQDEQEVPDQCVIHAAENARHVISMSCSPDASWQCGEPLMALLSANVATEVKGQAISVFSELIRSCALPEMTEGYLSRFQTMASPATALLVSLDVEELQFAGLTCLNLLFQNPPSMDYLTAFHTANGVERVLRTASQPIRRLHQPMLAIVESFSRYDCGRAILRATVAPEVISTLLTDTVETMTTVSTNAMANPSASIEFSSEDAESLLTIVAPACRSFARIFFAHEVPCLTDQSAEYARVITVIQAMITFVQKDLSAAISANAAASAPPPPTPSNAAAAAVAASAAATAAAIAALFPYSASKCVVILTSLGRIVARSEQLRLIALSKGLLPLLFDALQLKDEHGLHQAADKLLHICVVQRTDEDDADDVVPDVDGGGDTNGEQDKDVETTCREPIVDPHLFVAGAVTSTTNANGIEKGVISESAATASAESADEESMQEGRAPLSVARVLTALDASVTGGDAETVLRIIRWLALVVQAPPNALALGESAMTSIVKIIMESSPEDSLLNGLICKCIAAIAQESSQACEYCGTDACSSVAAVITFLQTAKAKQDVTPLINSAPPPSLTSDHEPHDDSGETDHASVHTPSDPVYKLEWPDEFAEPETFKPQSLTASRERVDSFLYAARCLEIFATAFARANSTLLLEGGVPPSEQEKNSLPPPPTVDFADLLAQRMDANANAILNGNGSGGANTAANAAAANAKKKPDAGIAKSALPCENIVLTVLERSLEIFALISRFEAVSADITVTLLHVVSALSALPGGIRALLTLARSKVEPSIVGISPEHPASADPVAEVTASQVDSLPSWPLHRDACAVIEYASLLNPLLGVFTNPSTCFAELEAAVDALAALTAEDPSLEQVSTEEPTISTAPPVSGAGAGPVDSVDAPMHPSDRFINTAMCSGALLWLIALLDDMRLPQSPSGQSEHKARFAHAIVDTALRFITVGSNKQAIAEAKRAALLTLYEQQQAAVLAAAAALATAPPGGKHATKQPSELVATIDGEALHAQRIEYRQRWATQLLEASFDLPRFAFMDYSALVLATELAQTTIAQALLAAGVSTESFAGSRLPSPLMLALLTKNDPLIECLLQADAHVDAITRDGSDLSVWSCAMVMPVRDNVTQLLARAHGKALQKEAPVTMDTMVGLDAIEGAPSVPLLTRLADMGMDPNVSNAEGDFLLHALVSKVIVRRCLRGWPVCYRYSSRRMEPDTLMQLVRAVVEPPSPSPSSSSISPHHRRYAVNVNACNQLGQTALHLSILYGHGAIALYLLTQGANPNIQDCYGHVALHYACLGLVEPVEMALQVLRALLTAACRHPQLTGVHTDPRKFQSPQDKAAAAVDEILALGLQEITRPVALTQTLATTASILATRTHVDGYLPWHMACGACSHLNALSTLCLDDELNHVFLKNGETRAAILSLLQTEYNVQLDSRASCQVTGLHLACKTDIGDSNAAVIELLLRKYGAEFASLVHEPIVIDAQYPVTEGSDVEVILFEDDPPGQGQGQSRRESQNESQSQGSATTYTAYVSSRSATHRYHVLLSDGTQRSDLARHQLHLRAMPLTTLQSHGLTSSNARLRSVAQSRYVLRMESAFSALHYALQTSDTLVMRLLAVEGISLQPEGSDLPLVALACAARRSADVVRRLVDMQVNMRVALPLHDGSSHHHTLMSFEPATRFGSDAGDGGDAAQPSSARGPGGQRTSSIIGGPGRLKQSRKQATALHYAVMYEDTEVVQALLTHSEFTNVNVRRSGDGFTPLHLAAEMGHLPIAKVLMDHRASIVRMSTVSCASSGVTPLHLLIKSDNMENDKLREMIQEGYVTREALLEGLGAPAAVAQSDEKEGAVEGKRWEHDDTEMEISCVLLDEEEHNFSLFRHLQQLHGSHPEGASSYQKRLEMELYKSDGVLRLFFALIDGDSPSVATATAATTTTTMPRVAVDETTDSNNDTAAVDSDAVVAGDMTTDDPDPSILDARQQFVQLRHWHRCYAQRIVRSAWSELTSATSTPRTHQRNTFDRRYTSRLIAGDAQQ